MLLRELVNSPFEGGVLCGESLDGFAGDHLVEVAELTHELADEKHPRRPHRGYRRDGGPRTRDGRCGGESVAPRRYRRDRGHHQRDDPSAGRHSSALGRPTDAQIPRQKAGLKRNKLTHKHTGLKDLFYALVHMQDTRPKVVDDLKRTNDELQQKITRLRAERDQLRRTSSSW